MDVKKLREDQHVLAHSMIAGPARALGLFKRVPALLRKRGWPIDRDLVSVLIGALALRKMHAGKTVFRRPTAAEGCGGKWPADFPMLAASMIVDRLELTDLLEMR